MLDPKKIDGLAYDPKERAVVMLLADALGWEDEAAHLSLLQDKINAYAAFVEGRQYEKVLADVKPDHAVIRLEFARPVTENCWKLVQAAGARLNAELGIVISVSTGEE